MTPTARIVAALFLAAAVAGCGPSDQQPAVNVDQGWIREPVPGAAMTAAYFEIENRTEAPITISGATSPQFGRVMMHSSSMVDGQMRMRPLSTVTIEPGDAAVFAPGSDHLMLSQPRGDWSDIAQVDITLLDGDAPLVTVTLPVSKTPPESRD